MAGLLLWSGMGMMICSEAAPNVVEFTPRVGEVLEYEIMTNFIGHGADQTVQVKSREEFDGSQVFNIHSSLASVGLVKTLSKYSETEELKIDAEGLYLRWLRRKVQNNGKLQFEEVYFNYQEMKAERLIPREDGTIKKVTLKLPGFVQDAVSLPFFFRKNLGKSPKHVYFYSEGEVTEVNCTITRLNTPIRVKSGNYTDYYQFVDPDSNITIMIGSQGVRVPFLIRMNAAFGKVESKLVKIQTP